jgi:hypothetical protein
LRKQGSEHITYHRSSVFWIRSIDFKPCFKRTTPSNIWKANGLQENSKRRIYNYERLGRVEYDEFYPNKSKPIIDEIDRVLAQHYGFTEEELDFIINYDIKYRMGKELESSE